MRPPVLPISLSLLVAACGAGPRASIGPERVDIPVRDTSPHARRSGAGDGRARQSPPVSGAAKPAPFPHVTRATLANGLEVLSVEAHALPIVQVRVFVRAGQGYAEPGAAEITAQLLKDGGTRTMTSARLLERIETLGADLHVDTDLDGTTLGLGVTRDQLDQAISILAEVVTSPRFDEGELTKLKARETDDAEEKARSDGSWQAMRATFRELFPDSSPYARYDAVPSEIAKVTGATVRAFHKRFYVPKNASVIVAGDVAPEQAKAAVEKAFGAWTGGDAPKLDFPLPKPTKRRVLLVHRRESAQSDVGIVELVPPRSEPLWPALRVANQVLGGGVASRLFSDVREQRSLAYSTRSSVIELAHGPQPWLAYAGTQTPKTAAAVQAILENVEKIAGGAPPTAGEVETARRFLTDVFAVRMETVGAIANLVVTQQELALPDGYFDRYRDEVRAVDAARAGEIAKQLFHASVELIVVAGDADKIAAPLSRFGEVTVLDPEAEFKVLRTLPMNPNAS